MNNLAATIVDHGWFPLLTIVKISIAFILGGIIGLERESKGKPVGFKTCVILSVASCVLTIVSIQSAEYYAEISMNIRSDPMRLAAQIISGVGFLGRSDSASTRRCYFRPDDGGHCLGISRGWNYLRRRFLFSCFFRHGFVLIGDKIKPVHYIPAN